MANSRLWILMAGATVLAACSTGDGGSKPADVCAALLAGDEEVDTDLRELGSSVEAYCACYETSLASVTEEGRQTVLKVSQVIANLRAEQNLDVDEAAGLLDEDTGELYGVTEAEFRTTGEFVDNVRRTMRDNGGQCPASAVDDVG